MGTGKTLSREEYDKKFKEQLDRFYYIPQAGEVIVQCHEQYPPYWFISNMGYLFSAYKRNVNILKPNFDKTGKADKDGKRHGRSWRYGTRINGSKNLIRYDMAQMVAEHFCKNEFVTDEELETHHIKKKNTFAANNPQKCNRADNLQPLPKKTIHAKATRYASKPGIVIDKEIQKKAEDAGCPIYHCSESQLEALLMAAIRNSLAQGQQVVRYSTTLNTEPGNIEAEAHLITEADLSDE